MNYLRLLALLAVSSGLPAIAGNAATLAGDSPFLPSGTARIQDAATDALELRGVMSDLYGYHFYVYDPVGKHGIWAVANETGSSFTIISGDPKDGHVEIQMNDGRHLHLKLRTAKVLPGEISSAENAASLANSPVDPLPTPAGLTPTQAAWREEVRRRQAENAAEDKG